MKRLAVYSVSFLLLSSALSSCNDYSSEVPVSNYQKSTIDSAYIGLWRFIPSPDLEINKEKFENHLLEIFPFNDREYVVRMYNQDEDQIFARGFLSTVNHSKYANVQILNFNSTEYYIYKTHIEADTLWYFPINKKVFNEQYKNTKKLHKAIYKHQSDSGFFKLPLKYIRQRRNKLY